MWSMIWPIVLVVGANTFYNICTKSTPSNVDTFASLSITYAVAAVLSVAMFYLTSEHKNIMVEFGKTNWTAWVLGLSIVFLEFGFVCIYRSGWKIGIGNLVASTTLAFVLLLVGIFLYKEVITAKQIIGVCICLVGLVLIAK